MEDALSLAGRIAVVTGAASGIGRSVTETLLGMGMEVGALDLPGHAVPDHAHALPADLRDEDATRGAIDGFAQTHGRLDLLVGNAGVSFVGGIEDGDEGDWFRVLDINLIGQMRASRAALPWLRKAEGGASIVFMSSCAALNGIPGRALYSASKGAVQAMAMSMAADLIGEGIRVNCVAPATVDTPFMADLIDRAPDPAAQRRAFEARQPTGRMVNPAEIGLAVAWLAAPVNRSVTGTTIEVDGGMGQLRPVRQQA